MVVLRGHEKNGVVRLDVRAQTNSLGQLGSLHRRGNLLREKRQLVVTQIEEDGGDAVELTRLLLNPTNDLLTGAAGTHRAKNDSNGSHDVSSQSLIETSTTIGAGWAAAKDE